jgi:hypothetical protein
MESKTEDRRRARRYATPTGEPCPYARRTDGTVDGDGACRGCGTCLLGSGWESEAQATHDC